MKRKAEQKGGSVTTTRSETAIALNSRFRKVRKGCRFVGLETEDAGAGAEVLGILARLHGWPQEWYPQPLGMEEEPGMDGPGALSRFLSMWYDTRSAGMVILLDAGADLKHPGVAAWLREIARRQDAPEGFVVAMGRKVPLPRGFDRSACVVTMVPAVQEDAGEKSRAGRRPGRVCRERK